MKNPETKMARSPDKLYNSLHTAGRPKQRSLETHQNVHSPELATFDGPIDLVLLGESMIERLKTTGIGLNFPDALSTVFNAGVGGDKIQSILYRLGDLGLLQSLRAKGVRNIILSIGTNNLVIDEHRNRRRGLRPADLEDYDLLLEALHVECRDANIFASAIVQRRDRPSEFIREENEKLRGMVGAFKGRFPEAKAEFVEGPVIEPERHCEDHVHLNMEGYEVWMKVLRNLQLQT
jgi:lysophospholipase L1-like esterase